MSVYAKEVFGGTPATVVANQGCTTTCGNYDASHSLSAAVIETMIEGYIAFSAERGNIKTPQQAKEFASNFTKTLIDNGDITGEHLSHIQAWVDRHSRLFTSSTGGGMCHQKLLGKILEKCDASDCPEIEEVQRLKAQLCAAKAKAMAKYSPAICKEITTFIQRYGRSMDQSYIKDWSDVCGITTPAPQTPINIGDSL